MTKSKQSTQPGDDEAMLEAAYQLISELRAAHTRSAKKLMKGYDRAAHEQKFIEDFLPYVRQMLADLSGARVVPYANNPAMQEVAVFWDPNPQADLGDYPRANITQILTAPYANKFDGGSALFKEVVGVLMEKAGLKPNKEMFVSASHPGTYACNMVVGHTHAADEWASTIPVFFLRANGDLQSALDFVKSADDATLKDAIAKSFKRHKNIVMQNHYNAARVEKAGAAPVAPK